MKTIVSIVCILVLFGYLVIVCDFQSHCHRTTLDVLCNTVDMLGFPIGTVKSSDILGTQIDIVKSNIDSISTKVDGVNAQVIACCNTLSSQLFALSSTAQEVSFFGERCVNERNNHWYYRLG